MSESRIPLWESGFHAFLASRLLNAGDGRYVPFAKVKGEEFAKLAGL